MKEIQGAFSLLRVDVIKAWSGLKQRRLSTLNVL